MALNIKDPETDALVRELARLTGQPITIAIRDAVIERLETVRARQVINTTTGLESIIARGRQRQTLDGRDSEAILGYDENGVPS